MKNWEKYETELKELGIDFTLNKHKEVAKCSNTICPNCLFNNGCGNAKINWFYEEYQKPKIKIPLATKVILENLDERCKWIAKDSDGTAFVYANKPEKHNIGWGGKTIVSLNAFNSELFSFISWNDEEPTNIKELLENCEVIDDE